MCALVALVPDANAEPAADRDLYERACAACHGIDGKGTSPEALGFEPPVPDFTDCEFASREPDGDWYAVIHEGGPVRAFDRMMPAFGAALSDAEINAILRHVRTFCADGAWPRGEFNVPRALFTEKAYPEDEAVVTVAMGNDAVETEFLYEKRFGARGMFEVAVPFAALDPDGPGDRQYGLGDVALGIKYAAYHSLDRQSIWSVGAEVLLPTGDDSKGFGNGTTVFEPYVAYARLLPADSFIQAQALAEFAADGDLDDEAGFRVVVGRTWTSGDFGRTWTPMLETLFTRELVSGAETEVDLVPQVQVSLNQRQHILLNVGVRIPAEDSTDRDTQFVMYVLWDWFDGGLTDGW